MRDLLAVYGVDAISAGELGLPEPDETGTTFRANARIKAEAAAKAATAGLRRRFGPRGRCARRSARHLFGALGRPGQRFPRRHEQDAQLADGTRRQDANAVAAISFRRCASPGRTAMSRSSRRRSTAPSSGRRAARSASATIRCSCRTATPGPSARCRPRRSTACRRTAGAVAPRRAFLKLVEACLAGERCRNTPDLRRLCALAFLPVEVPLLRLQQPCPPCRHRRAAVPARLPDRDRLDRRARRPAAPCRASSSAAARRR